MGKKYIIEKDGRFYVNIPITIAFGVLAVAATLFIYGVGFSWIARCITCVLLFLIMQSDIKYKKIPKPYTNALFCVALLDMFGGLVPVGERLLWFAICMVPLYILVYFNPKAIGGGDMRLISYMALIMGRNILWMLFLTICIVFIYLVVKKIAALSRKLFIPMGGFVAVSVYIMFALDYFKV